MSIIAQFQDDLAALDLQRRCCRLASRMSRDVVDAFLENQEHLATDFGVDPHVLIRSGGVEVELNVARRQAIAGKPSHPVRQIDNVVALGIHRPNNIAHRFN